MTERFSCKLTPAELRQRKATLISQLNDRIVERIETEEGFRYRFRWTEETVDLVDEFIEAERDCCGFLRFSRNVVRDRSFVFMDVSGSAGAKDFIRTTLELAPSPE